MKVSRFAAAVSLVLTTSSCGGSQTSSTSGGKITVLLKDAPADVRAAVVTIAEVDLLGGPGGDVVLTTTPVTTNLLTLANDVETLVSGAAIPPGSYSQLRFVITGGYLDVAGNVYASSPDYAGLPAGAVVGGELRMPSYRQSGLKVILPEGFTVGSDSVLVVDFDVSRSFGHADGKSGAWEMHPVVKATEVEGTGAIRVTLAVRDDVQMGPFALTHFQAVLTPVGGADSVVVPLTDAGNGTAAATFQYLLPGDYDVSFQAPYQIPFVVEPSIPYRVSVVAGQTTSVDFLLVVFSLPG